MAESLDFIYHDFILDTMPVAVRSLVTTYVPMPALANVSSIVIILHPYKSKIEQTYVDSSDLRHNVSSANPSITQCTYDVEMSSLTLITGGSIKHTIDLENVAVAVIAMELVARAIKAQDNLAGFALESAGIYDLICHWALWARWHMGREELFVAFPERRLVCTWTEPTNVVLITTRREM
jgi:hypothetical protein